MLRLTDTVHSLLAARVRPGDSALDLTAGNGHDTAALARLVGPGGLVWAFDIQPQAIEATRVRLLADGLLDRVRLIQADHCGWLRHAPAASGTLSAAVANLGYLPGSDKSTVTRPESSLPALSTAWQALRPGGLLAVLIYRAHPGGADEDVAIATWAAAQAATPEWHDPAPPLGPRLLVLHRPGPGS